MTTPTEKTGPSREQLHERFLSILPRIRLHAEIHFRNLSSGPERDDAIAETIALSWRWFQRLVQRGKDPCQFASTLARYAARAVTSGRRVCGQERPNDAFSCRAQRKHGFSVGILAEDPTMADELIREALRENTVSPVFDQVCFRLDFRSWIKLLSDRDRRIVLEMTEGHRTQHLARKFGVSAARVSQLRRKFYDDWTRFVETPERDEQAYEGTAAA